MMRDEIDVVRQVQERALRTSHWAADYPVDLLSQPNCIGMCLLVPSNNRMAIFFALRLLTLKPFKSQDFHKIGSKKVVKCVPLVRPMNPVSDCYNALRVDHCRDYPLTQSLLLCSLGFLCFCSLQRLLKCDLIDKTSFLFARRVTVALLILFPAAARARLVSSNLRHE